MTSPCLHSSVVRATQPGFSALGSLRVSHQILPMFLKNIFPTFFKNTTSAGGRQFVPPSPPSEPLSNNSEQSLKSSFFWQWKSHFALKTPCAWRKSCNKNPVPIMSLLCICFASVSPALLGSLPVSCCSPCLCHPDSFFFFQGPGLSQISVFWSHSSQHCHNSPVKTALSLGWGARSPSQGQSSSHIAELTSYPGHSFISLVFLFLCFLPEWWMVTLQGDFPQVHRRPSGINES